MVAAWASASVPVAMTRSPLVRTAPATGALPAPSMIAAVLDQDAAHARSNRRALSASFRVWRCRAHVFWGVPAHEIGAVDHALIADNAFEQRQGMRVVQVVIEP